MKSSNCCEPAKPNSLHPNHNMSWHIYRYFVCRRFLVQMCSCGWKWCFHGRCSLPPCPQGLFSCCWKICHMSVKRPKGGPGCRRGSCQCKLIFCQRESVWKWGLMLLVHWSHQLCCRFIVSIYLNNLCDFALVYLLCFSHACLKSNMSFADLWCFAAYLNVKFLHFLGWGILNIWCFLRGKTSFISS